MDEARTVIDQEVQPIIRPTVGLLLEGARFHRALSSFSFGLTWRDTFSVPLQIPVTVLLGPIPLNIDVKSALLWTPMQAVVGVAYRTEDLTLALDVSWNQWSQYKPPTLELDLDVVIPVVDIDLKNAVNGPPRTHDTWTPRVGVEWRAFGGQWTDIWVRGGYAYEPTPFPEQTGATNYLDDNRHILSAGAGVSLRKLPWIGELGRTFHFDLGFQYNLIESSVHHKSRVNPLFVVDDNPLGFPPLEDEAGNPIADPAFPTIEGKASALLILFTARTTFGGGGP